MVNGAAESSLSPNAADLSPKFLDSEVGFSRLATEMLIPPNFAFQA
jgi:hypothetical protein